ncbi:hypothetical protein PMI13_03513 [Chryseobacterium populi]|uniref:Uncharacterized protein n=2 Tax=Chryseobacterium populi TaxID=1144316 RepID=J2JLJ1_9FLAO|nr:hypothetical protein PMI13_03513 [Chryseobacterium populi]
MSLKNETIMKNQLILLFTLISFAIYAQIGINTNNPQTTLHVDGAKDNATRGPLQQLNRLMMLL